MARKYSSISVATTLNGTISSSTTTIQVATGTAALLLGGVSLAVGNVDQFAIAIDPDTASEEILFVTAVSGDILTVVRACASSTALTHTTGATIQHVLTGEDLDYFNNQAAASFITAKGDVLAGTASGTIDNLAVGANGTALVANSATATGLNWAVPTDTTKIPIAGFTAKGAILVGTGSGTYATQTVGTNGQLLIADSTQADGIKWGDLDTGNALYPIIMNAY
jgi:hypothetical protein